MLDVVRLLNLPLPWDLHGTSQPIPETFGTVLQNWKATPDRFFQMASDAGELFDETESAHYPFLMRGIEAPRPSSVTLEIDSIDDIETCLKDHAEAEGLITFVILTRGDVTWNRSLHLEALQNIQLDFSRARIDLSYADGPLLSMTSCRRVSVRGLVANVSHLIGIEISRSDDVMISGCIFSGANDAAVLLSGANTKVLIDSCYFVRNPANCVRVFGDCTGTIISRCNFEGPSNRPFIELLKDRVAVGFGHSQLDGDGDSPRDALTMMSPVSTFIIENRFSTTAEAAIFTMGALNFTVVRNDFKKIDGCCVYTTEQSIGALIGDNRITLADGAGPPAIEMFDTAYPCIFRNTIDAVGRIAIRLTGAFGGGVIALNTMLYKKTAGLSDPSVVLDPGPAGTDKAPFLSMTVMLNTIRGPVSSGLQIEGELPRLFLFDNHVFGTTDWSLASTVTQPYVTSLNNWSVQRSLNMTLSERIHLAPREVRGPMPQKRKVEPSGESPV